jgi:hypothetical protein
MEGDVARLCDTKRKTCATTKEDNNALNMTVRGHGDGDADGTLCKIGNVGVTDVNE